MSRLKGTSTQTLQLCTDLNNSESKFLMQALIAAVKNIDRD